MPRQPQWFQHVPAALEQLEAFPGPVLDRAALEQLLHVSRRDAIRLLHRFGGLQAGRTFLIPRLKLMEALRSVQGADTFQLEERRRRRLAEDLADARRHLRTRQVKLPVPVAPRVASSLPDGIEVVRPGVLEVHFSSGEELLARLFQLVQTADDDLVAFEAALGEKP